jgi:hypothetical protein
MSLLNPLSSTAEMVLSQEKTLAPMEELAIFKFDEELALEEIRRPKAPKEFIKHRRGRYVRRGHKRAP